MRVILFIYLLSPIVLYSNNPLKPFERLVNKKWTASGSWGDGKKFEQEITFTYSLDSQIVIANTIGFLDEAQTRLGQRNHGIRKFDAQYQQIKFWEFDVFGGITEGEVLIEDDNIIYQYNYDGIQLTDIWEYVDDRTYNFTVGEYQEGEWKTKYLETQFKVVDDMAETTGDYTLVIEGMDWGAAATKVILPLTDSISEVDGDAYEVRVKRSTDCAILSDVEASGSLNVLYAYPSDVRGNRLAKSNHVTLVLYAAPFEPIGSPIKYFFQNPNCNGNVWIDFELSIINKTSHQIWNKESNRIIPLIDDFDLSGSFENGNTKLTYASYTPAMGDGKRPLIIWLHGGGEGGTDPSIPLIANRAANYASEEIQSYFDGAYVLVPQSPTFWMDKGNEIYTRGEVDDIYFKSLMALIEDFVDNNPNIDTDRIYIGGCSNGGYMTLKLLMLRPDYFAAAFPSALALFAENLSEDDIERIKKVPIWLIHSNDDPVTPADKTAIPTYKKLIDAGAPNVHFSLYDHVVDITNQFGGDSFHYNGHFSWIYAHANKCQLDYDGSSVKINDRPVSLMGWLAAQTR